MASKYLKKSILVGVKMVEAYSISILRRILMADKENGVLWDDDVKKINNYILSYNGKTEKEVTYLFGSTSECDYGRVYADKSFGQLWSAVKNTVSADLYIDIDMVNSQANIMYQIAIKDLKMGAESLPQFTKYVNDRQNYIQQVMTHYNVSKRLAKLLFITLMNGGCLFGWKQEHKIYCGMDMYELNQFSAESVLIAKRFFGEYPEIYATIVADAHFKSDKNITMKAFSRVVKNIEALCLEKLYIRCGYPRYGSLEHDGMRIKKDLLIAEDGTAGALFDAIFGTMADIESEYRLELTFEVKVPTEFLPLSDETEVDGNFEYFDVDYFEQLTTYQEKKKYFEVFHFLTFAPKPMYYHLSWKLERLELNDWNAKTDLSTAFRNRHFIEMIEEVTKNKKGEEQKKLVSKKVKFVDRWLMDPSMRTYNEIDFVPSNRIATKLSYWNGKNERIYNSFLGYSLKCATKLPDEERRDKLLKVWTDLVFELCGANEEFYNLYVNALAHKIQFPDEKSRAGCFIFKSLQGCGKNMSLTPFEVILGEYYISSSEERDFWGTYADSFYRKIIINLNEMQLDKNGHDYEGKIKSFISEEFMNMNQKFKKVRKVRNVGLPIIFTNKPKPMAIDFRTGDRRLNVSESTSVYLKYGEEFWTGMNKLFRSDEFIATFYDFLNKRDISGVKWKQVKTPAYIEMCSQYVSTEILWLGDWVEKHINYSKAMKEELPTRFDVSTLYNKYIEFCTDYRIKPEMVLNKHKFTTTITDLNIGITSKKSSVMVFDMDLIKVKEELIKRKLITKDENDEQGDIDITEEPKLNVNIFEMYGLEEL